jgi:hypothetical protein
MNLNIKGLSVVSQGFSNVAVVMGNGLTSEAFSWFERRINHFGTGTTPNLLVAAAGNIGQ